MKAKPNELVSLKIPAALADEIRRRARADDRTLSGYVRRLLAAAIRLPKTAAPNDPDERDADAAS